MRAKTNRNAYFREYYRRNRAKIIETQKRSRERHPDTTARRAIRNVEHTRERMRAYRDANREKLREYFREYRKKWKRRREREKAKAQDMLNAEIRAGRITRPANCSGCGKPGGTGVAAIQGHHHLGYKAENWFNVVWLCRDCHAVLHRKHKRIA